MDDQIAGAYGFASLSLQVALLNLLVLKGVITTAEAADVTALAAQSVESTIATSPSPDTARIAEQCLASIAQSWAARARG